MIISAEQEDEEHSIGSFRSPEPQKSRMEEHRLSSTSILDSDEKIGEFWDSHDFTEFDSDAPDAEFEIISTVPVQLELLTEIEKQARKRGVKVETLVNQWL